MTFLLGWLLGGVSFAAGWIVRAMLVERRPARLSVPEIPPVRNIAAELERESPAGVALRRPHDPAEHPPWGMYR
jgi:hypothetical protein